MKQKDLSALIRTNLLAGLARYGASGIPVKQAYQPTTQGRVTACVYFWLVSDNPEGMQYRDQVTDPTTLQLTTRETQNIASTFQIGALIPDDPTNDIQLTAKDVTLMCRQIVQSQPFLVAMTAQNVGVRRPSDIREPAFVNEQNQFEYRPSFDFTVTHKQSIMQLTDSITSVEFNLHRV